MSLQEWLGLDPEVLSGVRDKIREYMQKELERITQQYRAEAAAVSVNGVSIQQVGTGFRVYIDGREIRYITDLQLSFSVKESHWKLTTTQLVLP